MNVPFLELKRVYLEQKQEIDAAVSGVLDSGRYILGKAGEAFESALGESLIGKGGVAVGCNSGTDALVLSMLASGVKTGSEVITPSHTAIPTITAIRSVGAEPVFAEIDPETWVLDAATIESLLTRRTKAIIAVHLYGNMVDIPALHSVLRKKGREDIALIEDVAQAQGSTLSGRQAGTLGRLGAYSFYPSKNIGALGDGGAIFAQGSDDRNAVRMLRNYGQKDRYNAERDRGLNSRLDEIQAAVLSVRLPRLAEWNRRKADMVSSYRAAFEKLPVRFQSVTAGCIPAWHLCVIAMDDRKTRDALMAHLKDGGVETIIHYPLPTHTQSALRQDREACLPVTESLAARILSLPMNACLTPEEQQHVIKKVQSFFA